AFGVFWPVMRACIPWVIASSIAGVKITRVVPVGWSLRNSGYRGSLSDCIWYAIASALIGPLGESPRFLVYSILPQAPVMALIISKARSGRLLRALTVRV